MTARNNQLDFAGFSGETLAGAISEPLDKIRSGRLTPRSIHLRTLLPDPAVAWALPCRIEDQGDDPAFRKRAAGITARSVAAIIDAVHELGSLGLVEDASAQARVHSAAPLFKLYIINSEEVFFGFYPVVEHKVTIKGEPHPMYDVMGKDATLFHHAATEDDTSTGTQYVEQARLWFDSMWNTVSREYAP